MSSILVRISLAWVTGVFALGLVSGPAMAAPETAACVTPTVSTLADAEPGLPAARAFVLVVVDKGERLQRSEAYGDWQWYLQSFIERQCGDLEVHQLAPEQARKLLPNWPDGLRNATLFANPRGSGLLHRGLVLEPRVYQIGRDFAEHGLPASEAASFGLEPFHWKPHAR